MNQSYADDGVGWRGVQGKCQETKPWVGKRGSPADRRLEDPGLQAVWRTPLILRALEVISAFF